MQIIRLFFSFIVSFIVFPEDYRMPMLLFCTKTTVIALNTFINIISILKYK